MSRSKRARQRNRAQPVTNDATSVVTKRARLANASAQHFGGDRDLYETFGYPKTLTVEDYRGMYERGDIAGRLIDAYPDATWRESPTIEGVNTEELVGRLKLWSVLQRLDRLTQLGHYGVLLLGLDGGEPLHEPATQSNYKLLYLQPHGEQTAQISSWNADPKSARFGLPETYLITTGPDWVGTGGGNRQLKVHWTRVIHIAEDALEHIALGLPRLQRIYNRLMDLQKLAGGSAEMYWQNVAMLLAFIADKDATFTEPDKAEMASQLEEMQHGLRRMLRLRGMDVHNVAPGLQGADPSGHFAMQLDLISGASGIPKRILVGNEAGELASTQDETAWQGRVAERREQFATPTVLEPLLRRGLSQGWLSGTLGAIEWPESDTLGERGRAEVADMVSRACAQFTNIMGDPPVTEDEFRATLGYDPKPPSPEPDPLDETDPDVQNAFAEAKRRAEARPEPDDNTAPKV